MLPNPPRRIGIVSKNKASAAVTAIAGSAVNKNGVSRKESLNPELSPATKYMAMAAMAKTPTIASSSDLKREPEPRVVAGHKVHGDGGNGQNSDHCQQY